MIALVNQGIVSFSIRLPFLGLCSFWSKTLEWWYLNPPNMNLFVARHSYDANLADSFRFVSCGLPAACRLYSATPCLELIRCARRSCSPRTWRYASNRRHPNPQRCIGGPRSESLVLTTTHNHVAAHGSFAAAAPARVRRGRLLLDALCAHLPYHVFLLAVRPSPLPLPRSKSHLLVLGEPEGMAKSSAIGPPSPWRPETGAGPLAGGSGSTTSCRTCCTR